MNILVCDDDNDILRALEIYLTNDGHAVTKANDGLNALVLCQSASKPYHLIIMDVMMPNMDGIEAVKAIRHFSNVPILFLSAKSEDLDRILGLNVGGDDYLTKPFNPMELLARTRSLLRRYTQLGSFNSTEPETIDQDIRSGQLVLNDHTKNVTVDGQPIKLTPVEFKIIKFLLESAGSVFSIDQIYETVWQERAYNAENTVAVHIRRIREKIEINPKQPKYLKVVWGIGYKIEKY